MVTPQDLGTHKTLIRMRETIGASPSWNLIFCTLVRININTDVREHPMARTGGVDNVYVNLVGVWLRMRRAEQRDLAPSTPVALPLTGYPHPQNYYLVVVA